MATSLWPNFAGLAAPRGMMEMLYDAAGDISAQTSGAIDFYIDALGVGTSGAIQDIRYNCYLRVVKNNYMHLLFRVTTPVAAPFPATASNPRRRAAPRLAGRGRLAECHRSNFAA